MDQTVVLEFLEVSLSDGSYEYTLLLAAATRTREVFTPRAPVRCSRDSGLLRPQPVLHRLLLLPAPAEVVLPRIEILGKSPAHAARPRADA